MAEKLKTIKRRRKRADKSSVAKWLGLKSEAHDRRAQPSTEIGQRLPWDAKIAPMEIDDPLASSQEKERIVVVRTIAADPLAWLQAHRRIDDAKYIAGRRWQGLYDRAVLGSVSAVDTSKEPVDGGRWPELLTDKQAMAIRELARLRKVIIQELGLAAAELVEDVLGRGMFLDEAARHRGETTDWGRRKWAKLFHRALDLLAVQFGLVSEPYGGKRVAMARRPSRHIQGRPVDAVLSTHSVDNPRCTGAALALGGSGNVRVAKTSINPP